eukprot:584647-Prymnesium_polylepis.1
MSHMLKAHALPLYTSEPLTKSASCSPCGLCIRSNSQAMLRGQQCKMEQGRGEPYLRLIGCPRERDVGPRTGQSTIACSLVTDLFATHPVEKPEKIVQVGSHKLVRAFIGRPTFSVAATNVIGRVGE